MTVIKRSKTTGFFTHITPSILEEMIERERKAILLEFTYEVETRAKDIWETIIHLDCKRFTLYEQFDPNDGKQIKRDEEINDINNQIIHLSEVLTKLFKYTKVKGATK